MEKTLEGKVNHAFDNSVGLRRRRDGEDRGRLRYERIRDVTAAECTSRWSHYFCPGIPESLLYLNSRS
jgi:hypothetical protein